MPITTTASQRRIVLLITLVVLGVLFGFQLFTLIDQPAIRLPSPKFSLQSPQLDTAAQDTAGKVLDSEEIPLAVGHDDFGSGKPEIHFSDPKFTPENHSLSTSPTSSTTSNTRQPSHAIYPTLHPAIDYRDPFNISRNLTYGPWRAANIPTTILAGEPFKLQFHCTYPDASLCPPYFLVFFHGPTRQTIPPETFHKLNSSKVELSPLTHGSVEAEWTIRDPGEYMVYAFPDFVYNWERKKLFCKTWKEDMTVPFHEAAVEGTPWKLVVEPNPSKMVEDKWDGCSAADIPMTEGRYISTNASEKFASYYNNTSQKLIWSPYKCKLPHRRISDLISQTPPLNHLLVIGDSTSRAFFCTRIWEEIHGSTKGTLCDYIKHDPSYWDQDVGHKYTWKIFSDEISGGKGRNVSFSSVWAPFWGHGSSQKAIPVILGLDPPPTHVIFTIGRWNAWDTEGELRKTYWGFLEFFLKNFAGVMEHIVIRTSVSTVTMINCWGDKPWIYESRWDEGPPPDTLDYRHGASKKRHVAYQVAKEWNKQHPETFKVSIVDAFAYTDNRPETTSDGRHWIAEDIWTSKRRPLVGEAEGTHPRIRDEETDVRFDFG